MDTLASKSPTPGGGSVAALTGALGSALVSMVGNLTLGKETYQEVEDDVKNILKKSEKLRNELENLAERDIEVFNQFMATLKLPKETKEQKKERKEKVQIALFEAANVPIEVARKCQELLDLCQEIAKKGNKNVISDAGVGAILAQASFDSAILNVKVNLPMIRDEKIKEELNTEIKNLTILTKEKKKEILKIVLAKIE